MSRIGIAGAGVAGRLLAFQLSRLGHVLIAEALKRSDATFPGQRNRIGAQAHLQGFYGRHGYVPVGETYLEDGITHIDMERVAP